MLVCPKKCLTMEKGYTEPDIMKKSDTVVKPQEEKKEAAGDGAAAAAGKPVMDAEKCVYCTLCGSWTKKNAWSAGSARERARRKQSR